MTNDALWPGPNNDYPNWPRRADGSPDPERMPSGLHWQRGPDGDRVLVDVTSRHPDGSPIVPPILPPP